MYSGIKEEIRRQSDKPNFHKGKMTVVSFSDSLIAILASVYFPSPVITGMHNSLNCSIFARPQKNCSLCSKKPIAEDG
jgi:hypothetical protein